jgi:hypothetical protein
MRSFLDGNRSRRRESRFRPQANRESSPGNRDLIRFRRNRELMAREFLGMILWVALSVMMVMLARSIHRVAQAQLAEQEAWVRLVLPALPLIAALVTLWRGFAALREWLDIRREQRELLDRLRSADQD